MIRLALTLPLILAASLYGAALTETAWSKATRHQLTHSCGAC